jgi:hypothetical protein
MIAAGVGLGAIVVAAWPEPTVRVVPLPYGEAQPKTAPGGATAEATPSTVATTSSRRPWEPPAVVSEEEAEAEGRVLAAIDPAPSSGPEPVPSELERDPRYVQESPEELGAEPLPGADLTEPPVR